MKKVVWLKKAPFRMKGVCLIQRTGLPLQLG
jgi:hypothetical protein